MKGLNNQRARIFERIRRAFEGDLEAVDSSQLLVEQSRRLHQGAFVGKELDCDWCFRSYGAMKRANRASCAPSRSPGSDSIGQMASVLYQKFVA